MQTQTTIHRIAIVGVLFGSVVLFSIASPPSARGQSIICCNQPVSVDGKWVGSTHDASCEEYARTNSKARAQICKMSCDEVKHAKELYCDKDDCKKDPKPPGQVYVGVPNARILKQPSETGELSSSPYSGQILRYEEVKRANGMTWYKITRPLNLAGWIEGDEVSCKVLPPWSYPPDHRCKKELKVPGGLFALSPDKPSIKVYSEPSADSKVLVSTPNGIRLIYREVKPKGGETWLYVPSPGPGRPPGWIKASDTACNRPGEPTPQQVLRSDSFLGTERPTASLSSAGRG